MPLEDIKNNRGVTETRFTFPVPVTGTEAARDDPTPPESILPGVCWRGHTSLLSGAPKAGKSTLIRDWIRRIGKAHFNENFHSHFVLPDRLVKAARILYFSEENPFAWNAFFSELQDDEVCRATFTPEREPQSDFDWFHLYDRRHTGIAPVRPDDRKYWVDAVIQIVKAQMIDMVVIDPITRFLALASENDNMEVLGAMMEMERIATEGNCGLLMLHHTGKAGGQARGASAFLQNVDVILTLRKARDGEEVSEATNPETVRVLEGTGRFDEIVSRMGLWYEDAEYHGTDHVGAVRPMNPQGDDADAILQWIKLKTPIPTTLEADQFTGFEKNEIMEGVDMKGSRFQRAMRTLVSKNAVRRDGNTRNTRYFLV